MQQAQQGYHMSGTCSARLLGRACANVVLNTATDGRSGPLGKLKALAYAGQGLNSRMAFGLGA